MSNHPTRRNFLRSAATGSAAALGLPSLAAFLPISPIRADDTKVTPDIVRSTPDLEAVIKLIEDTPRDKCVPVLVEQLRAGLPYRQFLAALFLAAVRVRGGHQVFLVQSIHEASLDMRPEERLLSLFWGVDHYKWAHEGGPAERTKPLKEPFPPGEKAEAEFHDAMRRFDGEKAQQAIVALIRHQGARHAMEQLWAYGCRDISGIGHRAIAVSSCCRTLATIGSQHAEETLRYVIISLFTDNGREDGYYQANVTRANQLLDKLPQNWAAGKPDKAATLELFALLRQGQSNNACDLACKQLAGGTGAQAIWDAVHIAAADMMLRWTLNHGLTGGPVHDKTSANALHYAFGASASAHTRLLVLLQAVAWGADFMHGAAQRKYIDEKYLKETTPVELAGARIPDLATDAVAEIFAQLPPRTYSYDHKTKTGVGEIFVDRAARAEPGRKTFALASQQPQAAALYMQAARRWLAVKAVVDAHDYKFPMALFEDYSDHVSPEWRPRLLAASAHYLHGSQSPDSPVIVQAREELKKA